VEPTTEPREVAARINGAKPAGILIVGVSQPDALEIASALRTRVGLPEPAIAIVDRDELTGTSNRAWALSRFTTRLVNLIQSPPSLTSDPSREFRIDLRAREVLVDNSRRLVWSPMEFRLILLFLRYPGIVFSRNELLRRTQGPTRSGGAQMIDVLVYRIRTKFESERTHFRLRTVRGLGYAFDARHDVFFDVVTKRPFVSWPGCALAL
jgi:DNA-binding winged helix-turn-helix (wHTH) protein